MMPHLIAAKGKLTHKIQRLPLFACLSSPSAHTLSIAEQLSLWLYKMPGVVTPPRTLYDKVFQDHIVDEKEDGTILLYIGKQAYIGGLCTSLKA